MTGLVRKATLFAACGVLVASAAMAGVPSPANSAIPGRINFVGSNAGVPDTAAALAKAVITVRDLANNPIANSTVVLDFSSCTTDTREGDQAGQLYQNLTVNCAQHSVRSLSNASGQATFVIMGGGPAAAGAAHANGCAKVYADGVLLGNIGVGTYDENGSAGVGGADLSRWAADFVAGTNPDRSNFDGVGTVGGGDLSLWAAVFVSARSASSPATLCP